MTAECWGLLAPGQLPPEKSLPATTRQKRLVAAVRSQAFASNWIEFKIYETSIRLAIRARSRDRDVLMIEKTIKKKLPLT